MKRFLFSCAAALAPLLALTSASAAWAVSDDTAPAVAGRFLTITVPGSVLTEPNNISDSGLIVGCFQDHRGPLRGFIERQGRFTAVNDPAAGQHALVTACLQGINRLGTIVGSFEASTGVSTGLRDRGGRFTSISAPRAGAASGEGTFLSAINDAGTIGGFYIDPRGVDHGFVLSGGKFKVVNAPHAGMSRSEGTLVTGVSDAGLVAGSYIDSRRVLHGFVLHGFVLRGGTFTVINHPHASTRPAKGTFIGCVSLKTRELTGTFWPAAAPGHPSGFTLQGGQFRALSDPAATAGTEPSCANDLGRVVGDYLVGRALHGFEFIPR